MKPIDGAARDILGHSLDAVVEGPTVMTIEVTLPFGEQVRDDRLEIARPNTRLNPREHPATHRLVDLGRRPLSPSRWL